MKQKIAQGRQIIPKHVLEDHGIRPISETQRQAEAVT
jgi:hypothetical protein